MPIFEYLCKSCDHAYERLSFGEAAAVCPRCGSDAAAKQLSTFAVGGAGRGTTLPRATSAGSCGDPRGPGACSMD